MKPRWALASLSLSLLLASLGTSIANVALPTLAKQFEATFPDVQWVVLAYLLASTTLIVSVARLGDLTGRRRLLLGGIALFTVASVLCGLAPTLWMLVAARALQGLGAAIMLALTMAFVGATVPKAQTGSAMGLLGTTSAIGTALGPTLGGALIHGFGWPALFLVNVPLGLLAFVLASVHLPADRPVAQAQVRFDHLGTLLLALTLGSYALATTRHLALLLVTGCAAALFVLAEKRAVSPLIHLAIFRDSTLSASLAMSALVSTVMMATLVVGPFYLSRTLRLEPVFVGLALSVGPLLAALTGVPAGRLADYFGAQRTMIAGLLGMAAGCVLLSVMPAGLGIPGYIGPIGVITISYALFQIANNTAVMADVAADRRGVISGLLNLSRNLGLITGASVMGAVFAATGLRGTFASAALLMMFALALAMRRRSGPAARAIWTA